MPATPNQPYASLETAIEEMIYALFDVHHLDGTEDSEAEHKIRQGLSAKYWAVLQEMKRLQAQGKRLNRLQKPTANSPVKRGVGRGVSKRRLVK